jgi:predicted alpha/beta superfamily hydrolase
MKRFCVVSFLMLFTFYTKAQQTEHINIGKKITVFSKVLNENRKLWIYTPDITSLDKSAVKKYPVLYVLDGDAHFMSTVGIVQQLSQANGNGVLPEMIVVAIENTNRLRDLTPTMDKTGEANKRNPFVNFLSAELIPYIDSNYNTAPYKLLAGHSLGGLTAFDILANSPGLFNAYIAIDPSMWYENEIFLNHTIQKLPTQNLHRTRLFIGIANTMYNGMTLSKLTNDHTAETQHIRSIFKLDKVLKSSPNGLKYSRQYYEKERHNTVPLLSIYDGLRFIFGYYHLDLGEKDFADSTQLVALKIKNHYTNVSKEIGYKVSAPESLINYFGYDALFKMQYNKAEAMFALNMENYPASSNVYDSYADFCLAKHDTANAITYYKKALQLKDDATTRSKLNALTNQGSYNITLTELQKYAGVYMLETYQISIKLEIRNGKLWSVVPGQADSELVPVSKDVFTVKGIQGYTITFGMDADKPLGFTSVQPNGTFKAVFKNK